MAKDRKIDMVILGLLSHEKMTGYDIKKHLDTSIGFFWKGSFGSIYPSLAAMEQEGLVKKAKGKEADSKNKDIDSKRERIYYEITEAGHAALREWLCDTKATNDLKYETLLKLFFGGAVENSVSIATIEQFEVGIKKDLEVLKTYKTSLMKVLDERDHVFFYLTVAFGVETYEGYLRWCEEAKELLRVKA